MSEKNPNWYELPKERWEERTNEGERTWRDSQRAKLYSAETSFRYSGVVAHREFTTIGEIQKYADKFLASAWVVKRLGKQHHVTIKGTAAGDAWHRGLTHEISLPKTWGWNEVVLLHELCHAIHPYDRGVSHGRFYCRLFLEAIGHMLGQEAKRTLRTKYKARKVKYIPRPNFSEEARAKMRIRGKEMAAKYF